MAPTPLCPHPGSKASRTHTRIPTRDDPFVRKGLESTNSILINVDGVQCHMLRPGAEIHIGQTRLRFSPHANDPIRLHEEVLS
jgi:hypothetical protein